MNEHVTADDGLALFGREEVSGDPLPALQERVWGALVVKWTKVKQPARGGAILCRDCITRAQEMGVDKAPVPRRATWKRTGPNGELPLCSEDAQTHKDEDGRVQREYEQRKAISDHGKRTA